MSLLPKCARVNLDCTPILPPFNGYRRTQNKGTLVFQSLFYLKHIKDMESKSIRGVQHQIPGEIQGFPYFGSAYIYKNRLHMIMVKLLGL